MIARLGERKVRVEGDVFVANTATVVGSVVLGRGCSVWFGAVIRGDSDLITLGEGCNVQDGAVLHTDEGLRLTLGYRVSIGHMAMVHGCTIGDGSLVGIRSVILNRAVIGRNCLVGAGTLISEGKIYPDGVLILGTPGRVVRELEPHEIAHMHEIAEHYVARGAEYRQAFADDPR